MSNFTKFSRTTAALAVAVALSSPFSGAFAAGSAHAPSDAEIAGAVQAQFAADGALRADHLTVRAADGVVYLSGQVDTGIEQDVAKKLAAQAQGVVRVVDGTDVANSGS